jgi:hypothetical protein
MKLSELKKELSASESLTFIQPNGELVPPHFHITEVGLSAKHFIDCGSSIHTEKWANFQIWVAQDTEHRLKPSSLLKIINQSAMVLGEEDLEVEIEYQTDTVGKYALSTQDGKFILVPRQTDCLAKSTCGISEPKEKFEMIEIGSSASCCTPGGGCC